MSRKEIITEIICKKYGSSAATLIGVMFDADSLSIGDIYRNSRINPKHLRELMILFFKLDLIQEVPDKVNHFKLNEGNVMETTRIHLHLYYIKKAFGDVAESLAITLAINGMISKETCITETYAYLKLTEKHSLIKKKEVEDEFNKLITQEIFIKNHKTIVMNSSNEIIGKRGLDEGEKLFGEEVEEESEPVKRLKKKSDIAESKKSTSKSKSKSKSRSRSSKKTMVRDEISYVVEEAAPVQKQESESYLAKINYRLLINKLRLEEYCLVIDQKYGYLASQIADALLQNSLRQGKSFKVHVSEAMDQREIIAHLYSLNTAEQGGMVTILDHMVLDKFKMVKRHIGGMGSHQTKYSIHLSNILYAIWLKNIEKLVENKFGAKHVRVFRAMQLLRMCNENQLNESCLLDEKDVRGILMELFKEELIQIHEINQKKGTYGYSICIIKYINKVRKLLFKSKYNLMRRLETEIAAQEIGGSYKGKEAALKHAEVTRKLKIALLELDKLILIFTEF